LREGKPNKVVARALGIREGTVKVFVRRILGKLHASNRTELALLARLVRWCGTDWIRPTLTTATAASIGTRLWQPGDPLDGRNVAVAQDPAGNLKPAKDSPPSGSTPSSPPSWPSAAPWSPRRSMSPTRRSGSELQVTPWRPR
jgi:hypothetical protein